MILSWFCSNIFLPTHVLVKFTLVDENYITNTVFINRLLENLLSIGAQKFEHGHNICLIWQQCVNMYKSLNCAEQSVVQIVPSLTR